VRAGARFAVDLLTVGSGDNAVEQLVQADLAARGIRLEIRQMEMGAFLNTARAADKRFDVILTGVSGDVSLAYLGALFESRQKGGTLDYAGFHTTVLDSLFRAARGARSTAEEQRAWWDVQRALARDVPIAWLYHARGLQGLNARLQHVVMDLRGELVTISQWSLARPGRTVAAR
jgi:peptide/nickel transport system substrate-binding protein